MLQLIGYILVGAIVGWIASKLMKSRGGFWRNAIIGVVGGLIGGYLANGLNLTGGVVRFICSVIGACIVIFVVNLISDRKK